MEANNEELIDGVDRIGDVAERIEEQIREIKFPEPKDIVFPKIQKVEISNLPIQKAPIVNIPAPIVNVSPPKVEVTVPEIKIPEITIPEPFSIIPKHDEIRIETSGRTEVARYFLNGKQTGTIRVTYSDDQRTQATSIKRE